MIAVIDDVLDDPLTYLAEVRRLSFRSLTFGADTFHGIAFPIRDAVAPVAAKFLGATPALSFFRRSPLGQVEPNFVHSDEAMGRWTGIYYMNPDPPADDGTSFWRPDGAGWALERTVSARFNSLLIFDAGLHHSRSLFNNYGCGDEARLIQVIFLR